MNQKPGPQSVILPSSLLIDPTKEPLRVILKPYKGITEIPADVSGPGLMVFVELNKCFERQGYVAEGLLGNIIWGFEQCGYDNRHVAAGLSHLREKGYIAYADPQGNVIHSYDFDVSKPIWIQYTKKFSDLFIRGGLIIV